MHSSKYTKVRMPKPLRECNLVHHKALVHGKLAPAYNILNTINKEGSYIAEHKACSTQAIVPQVELHVAAKHWRNLHQDSCKAAKDSKENSHH